MASSGSTALIWSAEMVAARKAYPNLKFEISDARNLPYQEGFDAVFSNATLHWIHEPELVLQGIRRALKHGGRFVAELGGKGNIQSMQAALDRALIDVGAARTAGEVSPWYYPSAGEYAELVEKCGLEARFVLLFDRPTESAEGAAGLRNWIAMFGGDYLSRAGAELEGQFIERVEELLRPKLFQGGSWHADYRRLRIVAVNPQESCRQSSAAQPSRARFCGATSASMV